MLSRKETVAAYYETHHVSRVLLIVSFPKQAGIHAFLQPQDETSLFSLSFTQIFLIIELLQPVNDSQRAEINLQSKNVPL